MEESKLNEHTFKVGDRVKCINAVSGSFIITGGIYTIHSVINKGYCTFEEIKSVHNYAVNRFILHNEIPLEDEIEENRKQLKELKRILNE